MIGVDGPASITDFTADELTGLYIFLFGLDASLGAGKGERLYLDTPARLIIE